MDKPEPTQITDDARYWKHSLYNNPNDPRVIVGKRYGIGYTFNIGSPNGKRLFYSILTLLVLSFSQ